MHWVGSKYSGREDDDSWQKAESLLGQALFDRYQLSLFKVNLFKRFLEKQELFPNGFAAPEISDPQAAPEAGRPWKYTPSPGADCLVYGFPSSRCENGDILWTPPHPGAYYAVIVSFTDAGWASRELSLVVGNASGDDDDIPGDDDNDADDDDASSIDDAGKEGCCG
jgi:hypothetical protein